MSELVSFKKCKFQAHLYAIDCEDDVKSCKNSILSSGKKVSKATHPHICAWRIGEDSAENGFDDNGETGAGRKLLDLLNKTNADGTLIAVTRWYGGSHLGSARFRAIGHCAKLLLSPKGVGGAS